MPGTTISGSSNIAVLDLKIIASLCSGQFCFDITPSTWIGSGKDNVQGAKFQITDPYNVIVRPYPSSFDIAPALSADMDSSVCYNIPTLAGNYKYGKYTITVELTDADGTKHYNSKPVTICAPNSKDKTKKYGTLSAQMYGSCKDGKLYIIADTAPNYNGRTVESQINDFQLLYPTISGLAPLDTNIGAFSVQIYEGTYIFSGEICATYNFGDSVYVEVLYKIKKEKNVRCLIDECCVFEKLEELNARLRSDCSEQEKIKTTNIILEALNYLKTIELAAFCGKDATTYIESLETLLGCVCTCNCAEGTPIINNAPARDILINGCNVTKETVGLTDVYTIDNYEYVVGVNDNGGVLVISAAVQNGCVKTQTITFSITAAYAQIKGLANADDTEAAFWASVINKMLFGLGTGIISGWDAMSFRQRIEAMLNFMSACCACAATINGVEFGLPLVVFLKSGADVIVSWSDTGEDAVEIWLDGIFKGKVNSATDTFTLVGAADGLEHTWILKPMCANGKYGTPATGVFTYLGCDSITPPVVSSNLVDSASCPFDLTSLVSAPPPGIDVEWHTANNTNFSSYIADPTNVSSGVYYAFAKDGSGCYSSATQVTVICAAATSCTAPQSLQVQSYLSVFRVLFSSAASPPPSNSYTVKRRLKSDPDVDGSYTTIGTPTFNSGLNKWTILDASAVNNTLYVYKAISNCGGSPPSTPFATYEFANISCPGMTITPTETTIPYSFTHLGGEVDKYIIQLYDSTGTTLLATNTHLPAFPTPVTGSFTGLTAGTSYKVKMTVYIGTYTKTCAMVTTATSSAAGDTVNWFMNGVIGARLTIEDDASPPVSLLDELSTTTPKSGSLTGLSGTVTICAEWASGSGNIIKMRICDANGNEVFYDGNIIIGDPASCFTTVSLPSSSSPYYVYVTAGNVEPSTCS